MSQPRPRGVAKWAPGDTAWVEFDHGTYKCELVSLRYGYWTVKWDNGDTEPQKVDEKKLEREAPTKRAKISVVCFVCDALGRTPDLDASELMCYTIGGVRRHVHLCCAVCAPTPDVTPQEWWGDLERKGAWPTCPEDRFCSTDPSFVPFAVTESDLRDEFVFRDVLKARAAAQRFAGRAPPYDCHRSSASLWRDQDRGTINGLRALVDLAAAAESEGSRAEILLFGAVVYRLINRLSTFSRWAAVCYLRKKHGADWDWKKHYEAELYGETPDAEARRIAVSGSSKEGRLTPWRDQWARPEVEQVLDRTVEAAACTVRLPRPSEIRDFVAFVAIETDAERGIMTAEHQSGAGRKAVCKMLPSLAKKKRLSALSATISAAPDAKTALDALLTVDTVGPFFAWQIFCDLVGVAPVEPDALPARVIKDSQTNYAIFGPGARKGAYLMDGGAAAYDVLNDDQDINQEEALARARAIVKDFPAALRRIGLEKEWKAVAGGRKYDLEAAEHNLCGFYGVVPGRIRAAAAAVGIHVPAKASSHSVSSSARAGDWRPNPCTDLERKEWLAILKEGPRRSK
jgi:hypothetical protein